MLERLLICLLELYGAGLVSGDIDILAKVYVREGTQGFMANMDIVVAF